jgi:hypothetical protein
MYTNSASEFIKKLRLVKKDEPLTLHPTMLFPREVSIPYAISVSTEGDLDFVIDINVDNVEETVRGGYYKLLERKLRTGATIFLKYSSYTGESIKIPVNATIYNRGVTLVRINQSRAKKRSNKPSKRLHSKRKEAV